MSLVVPAVLPSSRADFLEKLARFSAEPLVKRIQIDIVDGRFVAPATWPYTAPQEILALCGGGKMLPKLHEVEYEIDLMCLDALEASDTWLELGATRLTFHAEATTDLPRLLAEAKKRYGAGAAFPGLVSFGLAINLGSDLTLIEPHLKDIAYVQFMGIAKIGRQGQPLDRRIFEKIRAFRARHPEVPVQVDGGINLANARQLIALGVSSLIAGSALERSKNLSDTLAQFEASEPPVGV